MTEHQAEHHFEQRFLQQSWILVIAASLYIWGGGL